MVTKGGATRGLLLAVLALALCGNSGLFAEEDATRKDAAKRPVARQRDSASEIDEKAVIAFVDEHHAELALLLKRLRQHSDDQYRKALRSLNKQFRRLEKRRSSDETRYQLELDTWKVKSRIELLRARIMVTPDEDQRKELEELARRRIDLEIAILEYESDRLRRRAELMRQRVERLRRDRDKRAEEEVRRAFATEKKPSKNPKASEPTKGLRKASSTKNKKDNENR
ncbi:hypothetical protein [Planctomycetes bacterium Pan216]